MSSSAISTETEAFHRLVAEDGLSGIYTHWASIRTDPTKPSRRDFEPTKVPSFLPGIMITEVMGDRLRIRLAGTDVVQRSGFDPTGKYIEEAYGNSDYGALLSSAYRQVIAIGKPLIAEFTYLCHEGRAQSHRKLLLPFFNGSEAVGQVMSVSAYPRVRLLRTLHDVKSSSYKVLGVAHDA